MFLLILYTTSEIRDLREDVSRTRAAVESAQIEVDQAKLPAGVTATPEMADRSNKALAAAAAPKPISSVMKMSSTVGTVTHIGWLI